QTPTSLWRDIRMEGSGWCIDHPDGTRSPRLSGEIPGQLLPSDSEKITPEANGLFQAEIAIVI
ncbi:hypothetical protein G0U57_008444, partial [Chelydra serpentina]